MIGDQTLLIMILGRVVKKKQRDERRCVDASALVHYFLQSALASY
jgi:hypothetical protein